MGLAARRTTRELGNALARLCTRQQQRTINRLQVDLMHHCMLWSMCAKPKPTAEELASDEA